LTWRRRHDDGTVLRGCAGRRKAHACVGCSVLAGHGGQGFDGPGIGGWAVHFGLLTVISWRPSARGSLFRGGVGVAHIGAPCMGHRRPRVHALRRRRPLRLILHCEGPSLVLASRQTCCDGSAALISHNRACVQAAAHASYSHDLVKTTDWCLPDPLAAVRAPAMTGHTTLRHGKGACARDMEFEGRRVWHGPLLVAVDVDVVNGWGAGLSFAVVLTALSLCFIHHFIAQTGPPTAGAAWDRISRCTCTPGLWTPRRTGAHVADMAHDVSGYYQNQGRSTGSSEHTKTQRPWRTMTRGTTATLWWGRWRRCH
jgi:hypothetical protein